MRILHVVPLISSDGGYGGPVSVARAQCQELGRRGHHVILAGGWDGVAQMEIPGVTTRLHRAYQTLPGAGFSGLTSPGLLADVNSLSKRADIVHVHLPRDLVAMPTARLALRSPASLVVQTHGMIKPDTRARARMMDALFTRTVMRGAAVHFVLTESEKADANAFASGARRIERLANGVGTVNLRATWDGKSRPNVVFCARLHARKRPLAFIEMAAILIRSGTNASYSLIGPDEGELAAVRMRIAQLGLADHISVEGALPPDEVLGRLAQAQVYVLPSVQEPFPMSLLEAMSVGLPSVITDSTGISEALRASGSASVTDGSARAMAKSVSEILREHGTWGAASCRAVTEVRRHYGVGAIVDQLENRYRALSREVNYTSSRGARKSQE